MPDALEFAQMFRRFGCQVTMIERNKQLAGREDPDVAEEVAKILREDGIEVLLEATTLRVEPTADDEIRLNVKTQVEERQITCSHLLLPGDYFCDSPENITWLPEHWR